ncbi:uncharacterized protein LOC117644931 isoform X3 [Thrips palmi]|uniref:Uncharacterized protein LOC117644931 isoform X3 n=1 Tax=Thrips palmi TaxID=161013 RepID=A0A6P8YL17_THRPL|nr:uncharacterized protein LOC117644931 isoform X3 [Thrips palmi]
MSKSRPGRFRLGLIKQAINRRLFSSEFLSEDIMESAMSAAKRPKLSGDALKSNGVEPQPALKSPPGAAIDWEAKCRLLQLDNARLSEQLAEAQRQLQKASSDVAAKTPSAAPAKQKAQAAVALEVLKYTAEQHTAFLRAARKAPAIASLDLSALRRTTSSYAANSMGLMALFKPPKWRPDKKVDSVIAALTAGPDDVRHLDLGDAEWATDDKYAKELVKLLRKYKKTVTSLNITMRALVQPASANMNKSQANAIDIISAMPNLTTLELTVTSVDNHFSAYSGEFQTQIEQFGNKRPKVCFAKVKEIELYLTRDWFDNQFGSVDQFGEYDEFSDSVGGGGGREEYEDDRVPDLLQHRKDAITHLDMTGFKKTRVALPIVDLLAGLSKLRSIALRSHFLRIVADMTLLESMELHVVGDVSAATADGRVSGVLAGLTELEVAVPPAASTAVDAALGALAAMCARLKKLSLIGNGWRDASVAAMLQGAAKDCLEVVRLSKCGGVQAQHFPALAKMPCLKHLYLPFRLQAVWPVDSKRPELVPVWE